MSDWPGLLTLPNQSFVSTFAPECLSGFIHNSLSSVSAAGTWSQNRAVFYPVQIETPRTFVRMGWLNGATINGNVDAGIYNLDGTKIVSSGSVAQAGVSVVQLVTITSTTLGPGVYYFAFASNSATATFLRAALSANLLRTCGMQQQDSAFPLPSPATPTGATAGHSLILFATDLTTM